MNANLDAKAVERNVWQDYLRDGLMELFLGVYLLFTGIVIQAGLSALFIVAMAFLPAVVKRMKERFTYPRLGYVKFPEREKKNRGRQIGFALATALIAAVIALGLVVFLNSADERVRTLYKWTPLLPALIFLAVLIPMGVKSGFARYYVMAALALAAGLVIPFMDLPRKMDNIALYFMLMGAVVLAWGAAVFANFVRTYPIRAEESQ